MLVALVVVAAAFYLIGYWSGGREGSDDDGRQSTHAVDKAAAREAGAEIGEKAAAVAARVSESIEEGSLTAKIKAKMVLDDLVKARAINVTTDGTAVTLRGHGALTAGARAHPGACEKPRASRNVVDRLTVR